METHTRLGKFSNRVHRLTWHKGAIPEDEIWIKLGGDKGGGTFKFNFQICNTPTPNSPRNTCVISIFTAPDTIQLAHTHARLHPPTVQPSLCLAPPPHLHRPSTCLATPSNCGFTRSFHSRIPYFVSVNPVFSSHDGYGKHIMSHSADVPVVPKEYLDTT